MARRLVILLCLLASLVLAGGAKKAKRPLGPLNGPSPDMALGPRVAGYDTLTWLFCLDDSGNVHTEWPASPDSVLEDSAGELIKFDSVAYALRDSACNYTNADLYTRYDGESSWINAAHRFAMMWFDLSKLPPDITIQSAKLCVVSRTAVTMAAGRAAYAVLDTIKTDERWLSPATGCIASGQVRMARASWNKPNQGTTAWAPLLENRKDVHDYGVKSLPFTSNQTVGGPMAYDVTYAVQHYAKYRHANAGFWLTGTNNNQLVSFACGPETPIARLPFLKVTFVRKPYRFPWNGYPVAFALTTDDQVVDNNTWKATADSFGYKYTLYCRGDAEPFTGSSATRLTIANLQDFYNDGYEIGHHSLSHAETWGLAEIVSDQDSMNTEVERSWLATALSIPTTSIRTFAYPNGGFNTLAQKTLKNYGYLMARCAGDTTTDNAYPPWSDADGAKYLRLDRTRNLYAVERIVVESGLFGTAAADSFTHASIKERLYDAIDRAEMYGHAPIITLVHDTKTRATYANGMDPDDWSSLCRIIQQHGKVGVFTMTQIAQMYRNRNMPVDAPAWADSAVADGQVAADSLWWGPR